MVFTLPEELRPLALHNQELIYELLLKSAGETLDLLANQQLKARLGISSVLHTWTRDLRYHPHVHCLVGSGGLSLDEGSWVPTKKKFLFPIPLMRSLFRSLILKGLQQAYSEGKLIFKGDFTQYSDPVGFDILIKSMWKKTWVVHVKRPIGRVEHVLKYLARYINRVAISDYRILEIGESTVCIRTRGEKKTTLHVMEFIRRFLLHVLPDGFHKIRHTGLYSPYDVWKRLEKARALVPNEEKTTPLNDPRSILNANTWQEIYEILTGKPALLCPICEKSRIIIVQTQTVEEFLPRWCPEKDVETS